MSGIAADRLLNLRKKKLFMLGEERAQSLVCLDQSFQFIEVERRICRWLSRTADLVGDQFELTQEFMSQMIGVRRTSVSMVANQRQEAGLIKYRRGHIHVLDITKLKAASCECYGMVNGHYEKIFGKAVPMLTDELSGYSHAAHTHISRNNGDSRRGEP